MPPLHKNFGQPNHNEQQGTHKNYDPIGWELYFDELFYLSDVTFIPFRARQSSELDRQEPSFSVSMVQAIQP